MYDIYMFINTSNFPKAFSSKLIFALFANYLQMFNSRVTYLLTARKYVSSPKRDFPIIE